MARRPRRNHSPEFKAMVALEAAKGYGLTACGDTVVVSASGNNRGSLWKLTL